MLIKMQVGQHILVQERILSLSDKNVKISGKTLSLSVDNYSLLRCSKKKKKKKKKKMESYSTSPITDWNLTGQFLTSGW